MKKQFLFLLFICLGLSTNTEAQKFYIRGGVGFGIAATPDIFVYRNLERDPDQGGVFIKETSISGTFGSGPTFRLGAGYMITEYFGIDLEFYYLHGLNQDFGSTYYPTVYHEKRVGRTMQARMTPSLIVKAPGEKFAPYAKFGIVIPFVGKQFIETERETLSTDPSYVSYKQNVEIDGAFSVGFESAIGLQYNINEKLAIYAEFMYTGLRVKAAKGAIVLDETYNEDGSLKEDRLATTATAFKEFIFVDEITQETNINVIATSSLNMQHSVSAPIADFKTDEPLEVPAQNSNYSSFGLNLGVKYGF